MTSLLHEIPPEAPEHIQDESEDVLPERFVPPVLEAETGKHLSHTIVNATQMQTLREMLREQGQSFVKLLADYEDACATIQRLRTETEGLRAEREAAADEWQEQEREFTTLRRQLTAEYRRLEEAARDRQSQHDDDLPLTNQNETLRAQAQSLARLRSDQREACARIEELKEENQRLHAEKEELLAQLRESNRSLAAAYQHLTTRRELTEEYRKLAEQVLGMLPINSRVD